MEWGFADHVTNLLLGDARSSFEGLSWERSVNKLDIYPTRSVHMSVLCITGSDESLPTLT